MLFPIFLQELQILFCERRKKHEQHQQRRLLRRNRMQVQLRRHALRADDHSRRKHLRLRTLHLLRQFLQALNRKHNETMRKEGKPSFLISFFTSSKKNLKCFLMHDFFDLRNAISCSARALSDKGLFGRRARGRATGEAISPLPKSF